MSATLATSKPITVSVSRSLDDMMQVIAVRALVYIGEQYCPYEEEFDGNDFVASTHLIVREGNEPIGTLRIRWFDGFAKFERICVRRTHRGTPAIKLLMQHAFDHARRKGYRKVVGHIQAKLLPYWNRTVGMKPRPGRLPLVFSDLEYIEVERTLDPHPSGIHIDTDALELLRPEGEWDEPGVLDRSACRGAAGARSL